MDTTNAIDPRHAALLCGLTAALMVSACGQRRSTQQDDGPTNAGLTVLSQDEPMPTLDVPEDSFEATRRRVAESAALLEEALSQSAIDDTPVINTDGWDTAPQGRSGESTTRLADAPASTPEESTRFSLADAGGAVQIDPVGTGPGTGPLQTEQSEPEPVEPETPPIESARAAPVDPELRKQQLVDELVGVLNDLARSGSAPGSAALALAGMETLSPDALRTLKGEGLLSDAEAASLDAARKLFDGLRAEGGIADPARVSDVLERIQRDLAARAGLRIARAELCTRVLGYGRYETFPANRFIAGRPQEVIVYAEVDGFAHNETVGDDGETRFEVELSQRLELYHVADDLNTWNRAAETDKTVSRNRVRDYYLINQVTLPANLTIGRYHLKVVMRDRIGGNLAEAIIPIEIVAGIRAGVDL